MRKIFLTTLIVLIANINSTFSQEKKEKVSDTNKKHEVKINALLLATSTVFDITYEYVSNTSYGFGASVLVNAFNREFPRERFSITPFYRAYFFSKKDYGANGFFVEGFLKLASVKNYIDYDYVRNIESRKNTFQSAIGVAIGKKWVNKSGFILEIFGGMGRTLNSNNNHTESFLTRGGITVGKRF